MAEQLREEQQRARISEVAEVGAVQVIDMARQPGSPVNTVQSRKIILAGLLGLLLAIELTLLIDSLNPSFRKTVDVETLQRLPTLGAIPRLDGGKTTPSRLRLPSSATKAVSVVTGKADYSNGNGNDSVRSVDPTSPAFESFRAVRTSLIFSNAVQSLRSIAVTSAALGDGKSTTTANLATAFAQQGMRVLAIDCDIRRGRLHKFFGASHSPGLMEVVVGQTSLAEAIHLTSTPNLSLLTAGRRPPNPTELLGSEPVRQILSQLNQEYDLLVIDTPPVLAAADAAVLSSVVDGVIVVVRIGVTDRRAAKRAVERMQAVGARVLGTVLNDPEEMLGLSEDYYYHQYEYADQAGP